MELEFNREVELSKGRRRIKSPLRLKYEAEIQVFRARFGGLEKVRQRLGLSRRKICQLLMVDPSAWTRWTRDPESTPPHIYRALEWYMALEGKTELHPKLSQIYLGERPEAMAEVAHLRVEIYAQNQQLRQLKRLVWILGGLVLLSSVFWIWR